MDYQSVSRRKFGAALATVTTIGLAGCSDDETSEDEHQNDGEDTFELDNPGSLTINLENENGEPVSSGVAVTIENEEEDFTTNRGGSIENGTLEPSGIIYEGEYTITVESTEGEFDAVEETVTLEEEQDETVTIVLEGATGDSAEDDE